MVKISVIMPVYNVEDYIEESLNSLLNQTLLDDIEVIMVDDGSIDNSRYIIEKYALDYENFHAYHKKNEGPGIARNFGIKKAKGEYIHFLDADDYIAPDAYERLYNSCDGQDFIVGNFVRFTNYNLNESELFKKGLSRISGDETDIDIVQYPNLVWDSVVWNKLYKREFLLDNSIEFPDKNILYEDMYFSLKCYLQASSVRYLNKLIYFWRYRKNHTSITQKLLFETFNDRLEILNLLKKILLEHNAPDELFEEAYLKWLNLDLMKYIPEFKDYIKKQQEYLVNEINEFIKDVPVEIYDKLDSLKKVIYNVIGKKDIDSLVYLSESTEQLKKDASFELDLQDDLLNMIDFENDYDLFEYSADAVNIDFDEDNLLIEFEHKMDYIAENYPNETSIVLEVEGGKSYIDLGTTENNIVKIPFDTIADKKQVKIKISYSSDNFKKEAYLTNNNRNTISFDDFDLDIGIGLYKHLIIDYVPKYDGHINLSEVLFDGDVFTFSGKCNMQIANVFIKNIVTFEKIYCPVTYENDELHFKIPFEDILNAPIKKWELNCDDCLNSIEINDDQLIYLQHNRIRIFNTRNKIMISNVIYNYCDELDSINEKVIRLKDKNTKLKEKNAKLKDKNTKLKEKNAKLKDKNTKLKEKNANLKDKNNQLNDLVNEFQSRKVVKIADKFKF